MNSYVYLLKVMFYPFWEIYRNLGLVDACRLYYGFGRF
jgi:hypothetical protein